MKFHQFKEGVGRIVKGVNTTPDVGPNQTSIEAGKFGNKVDKDGRPPTLSKKVKGSKTNVLFNLGMAEGKEQQKPIKPRDPNAQTMQDLRKSGAMGAHKDKKKLAKQGYQKHKTKFDEDKEVAQPSEIFVDMDGVLADFFGSWKKLVGKDWRKIDDIDSALQKIRDTENFWLDIPPTKNANNLLGIIKKIKGSYNILSAPLPNDPNSEPHKREWIKNHLKGFPPNRVIITHDKAKYATQPDGTPNILIDDYGINVQKWESAGGVGFKHKDHKFERTARNLAAHLKEPVKEDTKDDFTHIINPLGRDSKSLEKIKQSPMFHDLIVAMFSTGTQTHMEWDEIFSAMARLLNINPMEIKAILQKNGFDFPAPDDKKDKETDPQLNSMYSENFADGKKKGKSRPGRVKKAGASCNGSVTSLRKRAKNASGEKAKMYHWCANMKSGRKKSESYTREQFYNILVESTPQQLEEGIKDQLAKLPKNILAKVQPIIKQIPKTGKTLVLIATLLGVIVNAAAAGNMDKVDLQIDKLNSMATQSATMDAPTTADKGGFDLDKVNYDREYKGDVNKVMQVQDKSVQDAKTMFDKLGGVSSANYDKMQDIVYKKIDDLRAEYKDATAKKGLTGKDQLHSDEYKEFRKQSNDLKIMLSKAMGIMTKDAGATGSIIKPTGKILSKS